MFSRHNPQKTAFQRKEPQKFQNFLTSLVLVQGDSGALSLPARVFWSLLCISPLLICAIAFLNTMLSIYNTDVVTRLPADDQVLYIGELLGVGAIILATIVIALLGMSRVKLKVKMVLCGSGVLLFVLLMVVFEVFISSSINIPPRLAVTRTGFSPAYMGIFAGDTVHIRNADTVPLTLHVSSAAHNAGIPEQLPRSGLTLSPGQSVEVRFASPGSFTLTSSNTDGQSLTITVKENSSSGGDDGYVDIGT